MDIIDTHLHLSYRDRFSHPWMAAYPQIDRTWTAETYFAEATPLGIVGALHMENDVPDEQMEAESAFMGSVHPKVIGAIGAARPEREDFSAHLGRIAAMPHVRGIRRILHVMPDDLSASATFVDNVRLLAGAGLTFDLCVRADQLDRAYALAAAAPAVQFVLDHCGNPDIANGAFELWRRGIERIASLSNVAGKFSGITVNAGPNWSIETLRPYADHFIEAFGWHRVVWGSDHPVVNLAGSLRRWVDATYDLTAQATDKELARLMHLNAKRIYRIEGTLP